MRIPHTHDCRGSHRAGHHQLLVFLGAALVNAYVAAAGLLALSLFRGDCGVGRGRGSATTIRRCVGAEASRSWIPRWRRAKAMQS